MVSSYLLFTSQRPSEKTTVVLSSVNSHQSPEEMVVKFTRKCMERQNSATWKFVHIYQLKSLAGIISEKFS